MGGWTMNKVILMGRLTRDPDVRVTAGEKQMTISRYTLAVDRRRKSDNGEQTADFISCVAFDRAAEFAEKYFHQGMRVLITGHIQTGSYTNKEGQKIYTTDVVIEDQEFADSKAGNAGIVPAAAVSPDGFMNLPEGVEDEGLPFNS
jgi:single-strand DNA-binding protein